MILAALMAMMQHAARKMKFKKSLVPGIASEMFCSIKSTRIWASVTELEGAANAMDAGFRTGGIDRACDSDARQGKGVRRHAEAGVRGDNKKEDSSDFKV